MLIPFLRIENGVVALWLLTTLGLDGTYLMYCRARYKGLEGEKLGCEASAGASKNSLT